MFKYIAIFIYFFTMFIFKIEGEVPGNFFWKPRLGLDMNLGRPASFHDKSKPKIENVRNGTAVLIEGYQAGITILALSSYYDAQKDDVYNPTSSFYYNDAYRWALRYLNLLLGWLGGDNHYLDTHKVWRRRFYYMDKFVPNWLKSIFFFVKKEEWEKEEQEFEKYKRLAAPSFDKYKHYPNKEFKDYDSQRIETAEDMDSSMSI